MLDRLADLVPPRVARWIGRAQYRVPGLRPLVRRAAGWFAAREGAIRHGPAAGLRFEAGVPVAGYRLGTTEPDFQAAFVSRLHPGAVVYDLGANVGFYSVLAARCVGPEGAVVAVEPTPASAARVRHNAALNGFAHVTVVEAAVADVEGQAWLEDSVGPVTAHLGDTSRPGREVRVSTVDALVASGHPPPDVVKVDVEGAETRVLAGMRETLVRHRPALLVEVHHRVTDFADAVERDVVPLGYRVSVLGGGPVPRGEDRAHVLLDPI